MNLRLQRMADRWAGVPLCWLLSVVERFRFFRSQSVERPQRILVILLSEMGSLVLARPMFARLKQRYPEASLHILMFARNRQLLDLLDVVTPENVMEIHDRSLGQFVGDCLRVLVAFWRQPFDVVIDCELFARVSSIFAYLSGAKVRVGFAPYTQEGLYRGSFINRPVLYNPYRHMSEQFLTLARAIESESVPKAKDSSGPSEGMMPPPAAIPDEELRQVREELLADFPGIRDRRLVLVYPSGGLLPIRAWPLESYLALCQSLIDDGLAVAVIGMAEDKPYGKAVTERCRSERCVDLTGYTRSVRHLVGVFHCASLLVTNDGGPGQFAGLAGLPAIVFFGPETPLLYGPLNPNGYCFFSNWSCSPCLTAYNHRNSPCDGDNQCIKCITPRQVLDKAREILSGAPASGRQGL